MPFNNLQHTQFFTANVQMGLTTTQRVALAREGFINVSDFTDFKANALKVAFKNVRSGVPGIPMVPAVAAVTDDNGDVVQAAIPAVPAVPGIQSVPIPARSTTRLLVASVAYHYYVDTGREVTHAKMHYTNVLHEFNVEWEAMQTMSEQDKPTLPLLSKTNPPLKWCESFKNFLYATFGVRTVPLLYVIRDEVDVPNEEEDPLQAGKAYGRSGSVLEDCILRVSHTHPLFRGDNATVYGYIEEAARGSAYAHTIKPFGRTKNGRAAWLAIVTSHVGINQWEKIERENSTWLINTKWTGKAYSMENFCSQHRARFQQLQEAAIHLNFQLPNEHTRVGYLLSNVENSNAALQAALANIRQDTNGMRDEFETAVASLIAVDPFVQNKATKRATPFDISSVSTQHGRGPKTGVDLRWYDLDEFKSLSSAQKDELRVWQKTKDGKKAISNSKSTFYKNKKKRKTEDNGDKSSKQKNKTNARISALEKTVNEQKALIDEQAKLAAISSALKSNKSDSSMAKSLLAIAQRPQTD